MPVPTPKDAPKRDKGPVTLFKDAQEFAAEKEAERLDKAEQRDARQDGRTDKAWQTAVDTANAGRKSAERTNKMLYVLLAACLLAVIVLGAMVFDKKLGVSTDGVNVGESTEAIQP